MAAADGVPAESKDHFTAKHNNGPIHIGTSHWVTGREEGENDRNDKEEHCAGVDEDAKGTHSPWSKVYGLAENPFLQQQADGDEIGGVQTDNSERHNGVERRG